MMLKEARPGPILSRLAFEARLEQAGHDQEALRLLWSDIKRVAERMGNEIAAVAGFPRFYLATPMDELREVRHALAEFPDVRGLPWDLLGHERRVGVIAPISYNTLMDAVGIVEGSGNGPPVEVIWAHPTDAVDFRKWDASTWMGWLPETRPEFLDMGVVGRLWSRTLVMSSVEMPRGELYVLSARDYEHEGPDRPWGLGRASILTVNR